MVIHLRKDFFVDLSRAGCSDSLAGNKAATLQDRMAETRWQAYSVRGLLSTAVKKHGAKMESGRDEKGQRRYRAAK